MFSQVAMRASDYDIVRSVATSARKRDYMIGVPLAALYYYVAIIALVFLSFQLRQIISKAMFASCIGFACATASFICSGLFWMSVVVAYRSSAIYLSACFSATAKCLFNLLRVIGIITAFSCEHVFFVFGVPRSFYRSSVFSVVVSPPPTVFIGLFGARRSIAIGCSHVTRFALAKQLISAFVDVKTLGSCWVFIPAFCAALKRVGDIQHSILINAIPHDESDQSGMSAAFSCSYSLGHLRIIPHAERFC